MWLIGPEIRQECPPEFQARVTDAGGVNIYDEPNFRLVWSESATMRTGGVWDIPELGMYYRGYRDVLENPGQNCWLLQEWKPAEYWGSPARWYIENYNEDGMQDLGGYPYKGRYETRFPLQGMPLNAYLIETVIPIIVWAKQITEELKKAVIAERRERQRDAEVAQIEDSLRNAYPALGEIRSAAGLSCLSVVQKKMEQIEQHWASGVEFVRQRGRGLSIA